MYDILRKVPKKFSLVTRAMVGQIRSKFMIGLLHVEVVPVGQTDVLPGVWMRIRISIRLLMR